MRSTVSRFFFVVTLLTLFSVTIPAPLLALACPTAPGDIAYWWQGQNNANDSAGGNTGTLQNGATYTSGQVGQAFNFDGVDDYVSMGTPIASTSAGTMSAWVRPSGTYSGNQIIMGGVDSAGSDVTDRYSLAARHTGGCPSGDWGVFIADGSSAQNACSGQTYNSTNFPAGVWTQLAVTYDGSNVNFYKDGVLVSTVTQTVSGAGSAQPYSIGRSGGCNCAYFSGSVDEAKIFTRALSANEVLGMYNVDNLTPCHALTSESDTMTRQKAGELSNHTIRFTTDSGVASGKTITATFSSGFSLASITSADVDVSYNTGGGETELTIGSSPSGSTWGASVNGQVLTITSGTGTIPANAHVTIEIGTNATAGSTGTNQISNTTTVGSAIIDIGGTFSGIGSISVPIQDSDQSVALAEILPTLTFDLDVGTTHSETGEPYTVPLGALTAGNVITSNNTTISSIYANLATNAANGASITVRGLHGGLFSSSASYTLTTAYAGSAVNLASQPEGFGICVTSNGSTTASVGMLTAIAPYNGTCTPTNHNIGGIDMTPHNIVTTSGAPLDGGDIEILVKGKAQTSTPAGTDYTETMTFIATGTF